MKSPILCLVVILIVIIIIIVIVGISNYSTNNAQCNDFKNGKGRRNKNKFQGGGSAIPPPICTSMLTTLGGSIYSCASNYIMPNSNGTCPSSMITLSGVCAPPSYAYSIRNQFFNQYSSAPTICSSTFIYGNQVYPCVSSNIIHAPGGICPGTMVNISGICSPASNITTSAINSPYSGAIPYPASGASTYSGTSPYPSSGASIYLSLIHI